MPRTTENKQFHSSSPPVPGEARRGAVVLPLPAPLPFPSTSRSPFTSPRPFPLKSTCRWTSGAHFQSGSSSPRQAAPSSPASKQASGRFTTCRSGILMEGNVDSAFMLHESADPQPIDPKKARFPCCIVWAPLPVISWFLPFIGHLGICREDGVILDFAGPNFVCVDHFSFGAATRYIRLSREKCCFSKHSELDSCIVSGSEGVLTWDEILRKSTQEFQHKGYNLFSCNCHSFVANGLNRMMYSGDSNWNVVNLAILMFLKGTWVNKVAIVRTYLPFAVVIVLGCLMGGSTFLIIWGASALSLVAWFVVGTYCFDKLIQV